MDVRWLRFLDASGNALLTIDESGFKGFVAIDWKALVAPAGTPPAVINRLRAEVDKALQQKETLDRLTADGSLPMSASLALAALSPFTSPSAEAPIKKRDLKKGYMLGTYPGKELSLLEERFIPIEELPDEAFPHSLGVHSGSPERVEIEFQPAVAEYVTARQWHQSQQLRDRPGGTVLMTLNVCLDRALRSWILSFGPFARVVSPEGLAREIAEQIQEAGAQYAHPHRT